MDDNNQYCPDASVPEQQMVLLHVAEASVYVCHCVGIKERQYREEVRSGMKTSGKQRRKTTTVSGEITCDVATYLSAKQLVRNI